MPRRLPAPLLLCLLLAACAKPGAAPAQLPAETASYACRSSDGAPVQHVVTQRDGQHPSMLLRVGSDSNPHTLNPIAGSSGPVFADSAYAWRNEATGGVLTDIANVRTYSCTTETPGTGRPK